MRATISNLTRLVLLSALLVPAGRLPLADGRVPIETSEIGQQAEIRSDAADTLAALAREVRLRRLHLVRPDLIPYPIAVQVYC